MSGTALFVILLMAVELADRQVGRYADPRVESRQRDLGLLRECNFGDVRRNVRSDTGQCLRIPLSRVEHVVGSLSARKLNSPRAAQLLLGQRALDASVDKFFAGIKDDQQRTDCLTVLALMKELTSEPAVMSGKAKVGFGRFHDRGKASEGDWFHVGFSPRKQDLVLYLHCELEKQDALLEKLGKHKIGKS